nr:MAG TPA: hypothetical protein [Inoviridae sp.]
MKTKLHNNLPFIPGPPAVLHLTKQLNIVSVWIKGGREL